MAVSRYQRITWCRRYSYVKSKQITFQPVGEIMYQRIICLRQSDRWEAATITVMVVTGLC